MDRLSAMSMFVRVVETGSFSAVAKEMNTTQPTVSKNVAELESWLGAKLLNRSTRSLHLTEVGADYYERCVGILQNIEEAEHNVGQLQSSPKGTVKVSAVVGFGVHYLMPMLGKFFEEFPDINVEVLLNDLNVDLVEAGVDLALRVGPLNDSALMAKKLASFSMVTVASPVYLEKNGTPEHPHELKDHNVILYTGLGGANRLMYYEDKEPFYVQVQGNLLTNNSEMMRAALLAHHGIALVPRWLVESSLQEDHLKPLLEGYLPPNRELYAVYPPGRHLASKARCFIDFVGKHLQQSTVFNKL